ncbi:rCG40956, partial [Rattus norvegicus]
KHLGVSALQSLLNS